jgi:hypothetical protein
MGKKRAEPDRGKITSAKVYSDLMRMANMLAQHKGVTVFDVIDGYLRPAIERDHAKMIKELAKGQEGGKS